MIVPMSDRTDDPAVLSGPARMVAAVRKAANLALSAGEMVRLLGKVPHDYRSDTDSASGEDP
ncbi:hypothetical protein AB0M46_46530 [Dactylosporangium sp. NPDC051485]|uniref:hypothetical protein n=1 Tax=Dactylosporangium sp. NPDC051485 TaxID=3154846 RepID=UPI00343DE79D